MITGVIGAIVILALANLIFGGRAKKA